MEIIIAKLLKIAPLLLFLASFLSSTNFFSEIAKGGKEFRKSREFLINKKKTLFYVVIILLSIMLNLLFFERNLALIGFLLGLGLQFFAGGIGAIVLVFIYAIPITLLHFLNSKAKNIDSVTNSGFVIKFNKGSISYDWNEVKSLTLNNMKLSIDFISKKRKLKLDSRCGNYYYFLKNIPKGFSTMDYVFVENIFNNLTTCSSCGLIALHNGLCLACGSGKWSDELAKEYLSEEEYIRENQLEVFATMDKHEHFSNFKIDRKPFARDEKWKPLVTKQEVLQYSKENYWE